MAEAGSSLVKRSGSSRSSRTSVRRASTRGGKTSKGNDKGFGMGEFFIGLCLIPFSLVLLWKNEKKLVTYAKCIGQAKEDVREISVDSPEEDNDYALVHAVGETTNESEITDAAFGAMAENSYRLVRTVEMYQWHETKHV